MSTSQTYAVSGLTCGHCVSSVTEEIMALRGVREVAVDLVAGGVSTVTVISAEDVTDAEIAAALDEAGEYHLVP
jgi:copper chaperone